MRSRSSRTQMSLAAVVCAGAVTTILAACNKPPTAAVFDAGPPPVATDAAPTILVPLDEDAGSTVDAAVAVVKHAGGPAVSSNQAPSASPRSATWLRCRSGQPAAGRRRSSRGSGSS
jgi:hypothetical protein